MEKYSLTDPDSDFIDQLLTQAKSLAKRHALPKFLLQELLAHCLQKRAVALTY